MLNRKASDNLGRRTCSRKNAPLTRKLYLEKVTKEKKVVPCCCFTGFIFLVDCLYVRDHSSTKESYILPAAEQYRQEKLNRKLDVFSGDKTHLYNTLPNSTPTETYSRRKRSQKNWQVRETCSFSRGRTKQAHKARREENQRTTEGLPNFMIHFTLSAPEKISHTRRMLPFLRTFHIPEQVLTTSKKRLNQRESSMSSKALTEKLPT